MTETDLNTLQAQAHAGDADAQHSLGLRLLTARAAPFAPKEGVRWVDIAAAQGHPKALSLAAVFCAVGYYRPAGWGQALDLLARAADAGDMAAKGQLHLLGEAFDASSWIASPIMRPVHTTPRVSVCEQFLPREFCTWIIDLAKPGLEESRVYDPERGGARRGARRTNSGIGFGLANTDVIMQLAHARMAAASGIPLAQQEATNVLHYAPGQEFLAHYDFLDPRVSHFHADLARNGQRIATFLVYLNDDFEGGETHFPQIPWRYKGRAGDALLFWNVQPSGAPEPASLHAGLAPISGEKWLLSKWMRQKPLPLI